MTSSRYAGDDGEESSGVGIALLVAGGLLAGVLVILAVLYAANFHGWRNIPKAPPDPAEAQLAAAAHRYLVIANPANQQLAKDVNAYTADVRSNLAAARADLRAEVATATRFDRQLAAIKFPAAASAAACWALSACIRASVCARACRVITWPRAWLARIRSRAMTPAAAGNLIAASCRSNRVAVTTSALRSARAAARLLRTSAV